jgi:hypothetical protein
MRPMTFAKLATATAGFVLVAATIAAPLPARAGDDDVPIDTKILRGILEGIGLQPDGKQMIDYHERPPLVIPSSKALPPPETTDAVVARNPAWPKDPDVARQKEYQKQANKGVSSADIDAWGHPLSPAEMMPGGDRGRSGPAKKVVQANGAEGQRLTPNELGYRGGLFNFFGGKSDGSVSFTGEPARASLTEPPPGYQTPSPDQPYGVGKEIEKPKATNYLLEHGTEIR